MTKADWLILAGYASFVAATALIYRPLGLIAFGAVCILLGRAAARPKKEEN